MMQLLMTFVQGIALIAAGEVEVGNQKQLFLDDRFIAEQSGIELKMNPAQKVGMVLDENGDPLSGHISRVFESDGKIRMHLGADSVEVLESDDGMRFRRTGVKLGGGIFTTMFIDPHDPDPAKKFKLFHLELSAKWDPSRDGVYASYSADGVQFTKVGRVLPFYTDNPTLVYWDPRLEKYVIFTRALCYDSENQRRIGRIETEDLLKPWPVKTTDRDRMFLSIDNVEVIHAADGEDNPHSDIYYNSAILYPWAQDAYLMFPTHFRHFSPNRNPYIRPRVAGQWEDFGMLEVQVATSRDGIHWRRPNREAYFPTGLVDEWDRWYAVMGPGIVKRGNSLYQYYNSSGRLHDSVSLRPEYEESAKQVGGIGAVRQRLDGFVSTDADHRGGWLLTPPLNFSGKALQLNIDLGAMGTAFVELQDESGNPYPGFSLADCEEIGGNFLGHVVHWKGNTDVSSLAEKPVRMKIEMKRGKLYAFQFTEE